MKKKVMNFGVVILFFLSLISCSQQNIDSLEPAKTSYSLFQYQNPNNPKDSVGFYHNALLSYYQANDAGNTTKLDSYITMTKDFYKSIYGKTLSDNIAKSMMESGIKKDFVNAQEAKDSLVSWNSEKIISNTILPYYITIVNTVNHLDAKNNSYERVINQIKEIESQVLQNKNITEEQKNKFFAVSSVSRYSLNFWTNEKSTLDWEGVVKTVISDLMGAAEHVEDPMTDYLFALTSESGGWGAYLYLAGWAAINSAM